MSPVSRTAVRAQPVCASAAERNWSVYGQIKTPERSRMGHAVGDKLVYCHEAFHHDIFGRHKVTGAPHPRGNTTPCVWASGGFHPPGARGKVRVIF